MNDFERWPSRREFLKRSASVGLGATLGMRLAASESPEVPIHEGPILGKARHCIQLWLGGGACQIDTWDPKRRGDAKKKIPGSYYDSVPTAIRGERVCDHLKRSARVLDRAVLLRTVHHDISDEHAAATNRMHTARPTSGTIVYPSMGSVVANELGAAAKGVPSYVVMGYPNLTRGPGFLGPKAGYIYLTDTEAGPAGLSRPESITAARQDRRAALLARLREKNRGRFRGDSAIDEYADVSAEAFRLAGPDFMSAFDLDREPKSLRESYGSEFGQRCLLARRLIERGVRFIEVAHNLNFINGTGWDTHNEGQLNQHGLIEELDKAFSTLIVDLQQRGLLDQTIIMISTEFGRPPKFDARGGRGHQSGAFSVVLAGGGLRTGRVVGVTDELGANIVERPITVPDLFATVYAALRINPAKELYAGGRRPVPITDGGRPIGEVFA